MAGGERGIYEVIVFSTELSENFQGPKLIKEIRSLLSVTEEASISGIGTQSDAEETAQQETIGRTVLPNGKVVSRSAVVAEFTPFWKR